MQWKTQFAQKQKIISLDRPLVSIQAKEMERGLTVPYGLYFLVMPK
jgi:hypothetical protein